MPAKMNPFEVKTKPADRYYMDWQKLYPRPYDKNEVDPYTRLRIILMNGTEYEANWFSHQFHRHCTNNDLRRELAVLRRTEQQQQKRIACLKPIDESILETTIGYEQLAVDLTAILAQREPDPYVVKVMQFALLEDFDHLYRYADLLDMEDGVHAERLVGSYTEIMPGRRAAHQRQIDRHTDRIQRPRHEHRHIMHASDMLQRFERRRFHIQAEKLIDIILPPRFEKERVFVARFKVLVFLRRQQLKIDEALRRDHLALLVEQKLQHRQIKMRRRMVRLKARLLLRFRIEHRAAKVIDEREPASPRRLRDLRHRLRAGLQHLSAGDPLTDRKNLRKHRLPKITPGAESPVLSKNAWLERIATSSPASSRICFAFMMITLPRK